MPFCLHIGFPGERAIPGLRACVLAFGQSADARVICPLWAISPAEYDLRNSLDTRDFIAAVGATPGPVLMLRPIQGTVLAEITTRLEGRQLVIPADAYDHETLREAIADIKAHHDAGEPLLPLQRVVGLLLVRKLDREHMWAGNSKGYMWRDWIPKGRGIDEAFKPHIPDLLYLLELHTVLISKVSNGDKKYALNPNRRVEIGDMLRGRRFSPELEHVFARQGASLPARILDGIDD